MPTVTLTITDGEDEEMSFKVASEPGFPGPAARDQTLSPAQALALAIMHKILAEKRKE